MSLNKSAEVKNLSFFYGDKQVVKEVSLPIYQNQATALIGPSGCGKTTLLRCMNRMHDLYPGNHYTGEIIIHPEGLNLLSKEIDPIEVRMRIGMVFQRPNPFPKSIFDNVS
jgi:phosphate transport system ATP-binding protein